MRTIAFEIQDYSIPELGMPDTAAHAHVGSGRLFQGTRTLDEYRTGHLQSRPYLFNEVRRQFADEPRRLAVGIDAIEAALFRITDVALAHGARGADIAEPALFLQAGEVGHRALMRKQAIFHAGEEHHRKLQSLGRVQR